MAKADSTESIPDSIRAGMPAADEVKPIVAGWVEEVAIQRQGKRTAAYHVVASLFDCSESWIRRLISGQVEGFDANLYKRIIASEPVLKEQRAARGRALMQDSDALRSEGTSDVG